MQPNLSTVMTAIRMVLLLLLPFTALAQSLEYDVLLDLDRDVATGCVVTPSGAAAQPGFERRLRATVDSGTLQVVDVELQDCNGAVLQSVGSVGGGYPVGLDVGLNGADVIELSVGLLELNPGIVNQVRLVFVADNGGGSDVLATIDGGSGGAAILLGLPVEPLEVPTLGWWGLGLLITLLLGMAWFAHRRIGGIGTLSALMLFSLVAWAMNFVSDGDVSDWIGVAALATDLSGDASDGSANVDVLAGFAVVADNNLFFRIDVVDLQNQVPVALDDSFVTDEDVALNVPAAGVLGNDSDGDLDPLTAVLDAGPANAQSFTLNADGSFDYTPNADFNGADSFTYFANDGQANSVAATVAITVNAVNDAPSFSIPADASVAENSGAQSLANFAASISPGPANESGQTVMFTVTNNDNPALFSVQPLLANDGTLTFTAAADSNGTANITVELMDDGGTANGGVDTSAPTTFAIEITPVNDAPSFTGGPNQTVLEDAGPQSVAGWATAISAGPPDEAGQVLTFNVTANDNAALFSAGPAVAADGTLSYTTADDANGTANITIELMDDGGTANGGVDTSAPFSFTIDVTAVNDAPEVTLGTNPAVLEDAGAQTVPGFASGISAGPADESGQVLTFNIIGNDNMALFSAQPALAVATGNLTFTPAADASGTANIMVVLMDDGGTANGGVDTSATQTFVITINEVNDSPSFVAPGDPAASNEDAGPQSLAWASAISAGPPPEAGQSLTFNLNQTAIDSTLSFTTPPSVNLVTGNVEYEAAANAYGMVSFDVLLLDNGGTANGGVDTFGPVALTITVNPINDPPTVGAAPTTNVTTNIGLDVAAGSGLLAGASDDPTEAADPNGPAAPGTTLTVGNAGNPAPTTTALGGDVSINTTTGAFTYNPPPGLNTGIDTFDYVICDNGIPGPGVCSATLTATINLTGNTIWFIDDDAAAGGSGRLSDPFNSIAAFNAVQGGGGTPNPAVGDFIFLFSGNYTGSFSLLDNQTLFGQGTTGVGFDAFTGIAPPAGSTARPTLAGADPVISTTAAASNAINVAASNTIRGLNIGNTTSFGIAGTSTGTLAISQVDITGTGGLLDIDGGNTGILGAVFGALTSTSSNVPNVVDIQNYGITDLLATSTTIQGPSQSGFLLQNNAGASVLNFGNLANLLTTNGAGFVASNTGTVTISPPAPVTIQTIGGPALNLTGGTYNGFNFSSISANNTVSGVMLNNVSGFISSGGGTIQNTSGDAFVITGGSNSVTYGGTITNAAGRSVVVTGHTGGNVVFNPINDTAQGVFLNNNAGTTFFFAGTMNLNTGANNAFTATNGGSIDATGAGSTISTSTGVGVIMSDVSFRNTNFTVQSVSVNGAANGIILDNTGTAGGFTVTGDGSNARNGSGGVIQNTTGDGILLADASNVTLRSMNLMNVGNSSDSSAGGNNLGSNDHGIQSERGGSIVLSGVLIDNPAAGGWEAVDLGGVNRIDNNSRIEGVNVSNMQALEVRNTNTNMTSFTIDDSEFTNQAATNGSSYVLFQSFGSSDMSVFVDNSSLFEQLFGVGLQANAGAAAGDNGTVNFTVQNSTFRTAVDGTVGVGATGGLGGIVGAVSQNATINYNVDNNTLSDLGRPLANGGTVTFQGIGGTGKTIDGSFDMNNVDRIGYPTAAAATTTVGHRVIDIVTENNISFLDHESDLNVMDDTSREAFFVSSRGASQDFDISITNNMLGQVTPIGTTNREAIEMLSEDSSDMEAIVMNNMVMGNTSTLDQVVDIDIENTSFMDMRFNNNTVANAQAAGGVEIVVDTESGTSNHCMQFLGNTAVDVEFDVNAAAMGHRIENFANRVANNPGVTNFIDGVGVTDVANNTCQVPDF